MSEEFKRESDLLKSVQLLDARLVKNEEIAKMKHRIRNNYEDMSFQEKERNPILRQRRIAQEFRKFGNI